jgi:hypothetical protein
MNKREKKRLRKGLSVSSLPGSDCEGIQRANLEAAVQEAKTLSLTRARNRPGEAAWVYRFSVLDTPVAWVGVRFSEEPETGTILDGERFIRLDPIIGYLNGQRISPVCTMVHRLKENTKEFSDANSWYSNDLVERWRGFFRKKHGTH